MDFQHVKRRQMYDVLSKRCGQPVAFWRRKLKDDWYMDAQKALAEKIIDEVYG
jgi:ATP-dependent protease ClpP protease subunit